jgi:hypothetical protein
MKLQLFLTNPLCGARLTLWTNIDRRFISWGAAGWHICFDVLDHLLRGLRRLSGMIHSG